MKKLSHLSRYLCNLCYFSRYTLCLLTASLIKTLIKSLLARHAWVDGLHLVVVLYILLAFNDELNTTLRCSKIGWTLFAVYVTSEGN